MSKPNIFNDAIAEAKAIRETAFSNARLAMAESFAPQIKSMLSSQLNEMEEEGEMSLDELLNELEGQESVNEEAETEPEVEFEAEENGEENGEEGGEIEGDEVVGEITVDELKDIIRQVQLELNDEEPEGKFEEEGEVDFEPESEGGDEDEEINLDEILSEMDGGSIDPANAAAGLDNIIAMIKRAAAKTPEILSKIKQELESAGAAAGSAMRSEATELKEAKKVIAEQSKLLKEMNLLNSKLLYVNKIFKAKNLTESQKVKVVNALDRCKDVKETKNTFLTLKESLILTPTTQLRENRGAASRSAGATPKALNEQKSTQEDDFVTRMQQLAGIIK
jgi:hypothetical protein